MIRTLALFVGWRWWRTERGHYADREDAALSSGVHPRWPWN